MIISIPLMLVDGTPTEAETALLSDPDGNYGVRRTDTNATVVADGTALTLVGDEYQYEFVGGVEGITYEAWFELTYDGDTYFTQKFFEYGDAVAESLLIKAAFVDADGELIDLSAAEPELCNPTGSYGLKRLEDGLVAIPAETEMNELGTGYYVSAFDAATSSKRYRFYVKVVIDGVTYYLPSVTSGRLGSVGLALGRYTNSYELGQKFGHDNIYIWAGTPQYGTAEGDEPVDFVKRLSSFIRDAEDELDEELLGAYVEEAWTENVPVMIRRIATTLAACAAYESRGVDDVGENAEGPVHRLSAAKRQAMKDIRRIKMGLVSLTDLGYGPSVGAPEVDTDD